MDKVFSRASERHLEYMRLVSYGNRTLQIQATTHMVSDVFEMHTDSPMHLNTTISAITFVLTSTGWHEVC